MQVGWTNDDGRATNRPASQAVIVRRNQMYIKAEDNDGWTIADEFAFHSNVDDVYFEKIEIDPPYGLNIKTYTIEDGDFDLGKLLREAFGDQYIKVIDRDKTRIFKLA